jgi:hypothetical protein
MMPETRSTVAAAETAINQLVKMCRKPGPLYPQNLQAVAPVSRTAEWLLNALCCLRRALSKTQKSWCPGLTWAN